MYKHCEVHGLENGPMTFLTSCKFSISCKFLHLLKAMTLDDYQHMIQSQCGLLNVKNHDFTSQFFSRGSDRFYSFDISS
jgi:hypothetical protein